MIDLPHKQIFSVLFAAGEPVETARVAQAIGADEETVLRYLPALQDSLDQAGIPLQILRLGDRLQLSTLEAFAPVIQDALALPRALIEQVRGVDSSGVVNSLIEKQLLEEAGRLDLPGRPLSYRTTPHFLRTFGLESLEQLPPLPGTEGGTA